MSSLSSSWRCARCQVGVSYLPGFDAPEQPAAWEQVDGDWLCLLCRREYAVEQALADAEVDAADFDARAIRRRALATFEWVRDPEQRNGVVAKVASSSPHWAAEMRRELVEAGVIERQMPGPKPKQKPAAKTSSKRRRAKRPTPLQLRIGAALKADAEQTDKALAAALGCSAVTVAGRRRTLERAGEIPETVRKGFASVPKAAVR